MNAVTIKDNNAADRLVDSPQFWSIVIVFTLITLHHYDDQTSFTLISFDRSVGLTRHTIDRILYLIPIILGSAMFGIRGGIAALLMALIAMLPRAIFISDSQVTALVETFGVLAIGSVAPLWSRHHARQENQLVLAMEELKSTQQKLETELQLSLEQKKQLTVVNSFSAILSQSLDLDRVLQAAVKMVLEVMQIEVVLLFALDKATQELNVIAYEGIQEKSARAMDGKKLGQGLCGKVAKTGEPFAIENMLDHPVFQNATVLEENLVARLSVPLVARANIIGTLCVASHSPRRFNEPETQILSALGSLIGIAIDNSRLYRERETATEQLRISEKKYRKLFENAHVAIWVQDLSGIVTDANQAAAELFGCDMTCLIGRKIDRFFPDESLALTKSIQEHLLSGNENRLPYRQSIIRKDGTEVAIKVTASLISSNGHPDGLQFIGRDITHEVRMQENQQFYLQQITKAHEEERLRISRDLHDSTAQNVIAALRQLEEFCEENEPSCEAKWSFLWGIHGQLKNTLQDIRRLSRDLRPSIIDDLGLLPAVEWLVEQFKTERNIEAHLRISGEERRLSAEIEVTLFRIVQEALRNIAEHSKATEARIDIDLGDSEIKIDISDNGTGFVIPVSLGDFARIGKLGIDGMETRSRLVGGTFDIKSELGEGTALYVTIPVYN